MKKWRCYHCDKLFKEPEAQEHFGKREDPGTCYERQARTIKRLQAKIEQLQAHRTEKGTPITFWLDEETVNMIDELSKKADMSRSRLVRNIIKVGPDNLTILDSWRLVTAMRMIEAATDGIKEIIQNS